MPDVGSKSSIHNHEVLGVSTDGMGVSAANIGVSVDMAGMAAKGPGILMLKITLPMASGATSKR